MLHKSTPETREFSSYISNLTTKNIRRNGGKVEMENKITEILTSVSHVNKWTFLLAVDSDLRSPIENNCIKKRSRYVVQKKDAAPLEVVQEVSVVDSLPNLWSHNCCLFTSFCATVDAQECQRRSLLEIRTDPGRFGPNLACREEKIHSGGKVVFYLHTQSICGKTKQGKRSNL